MRIAGRSRPWLTSLVAAAAAGLATAPAAAQTPDFVALGQGSFPSLASTWQANAVAPNTVLLDLYDHEAILYQSYSTMFEAPSKRTVSATGQRPLGLPTVAALVGGAAGKRVKTVKIYFAGAPAQKVRTVSPLPGWGFAGRFFAAGANVAETSANTTQVVTKIKALDGRGRLLSKLTDVFTNPF
jgi:hypothetical protein